MNRQKRTKLFFSLYLKEIADNPDAKRYTCYLRAEAQMITETGRRQYNKYETFRAAISRAQKERRALLMISRIEQMINVNSEGVVVASNE